MESEMNQRISWDEYFMKVAFITSQRSPCKRLQVGCTIVKDKHIIASGYNGFLPGGEHNSIVRDNHEQATVHSEQNAIADAASRGVSVKGATAYVTHYPCINCFKILVAAKIEKIYYYYDYKNDEIIEQILNDPNLNIEIIKLSY